MADKSQQTCYGCGNLMAVAPQSTFEKVKGHRTHVLWLCADKDCADEWANAGLPGVVQCSCGRFWGQVP